MKLNPKPRHTLRGLLVAGLGLLVSSTPPLVAQNVAGAPRSEITANVVYTPYNPAAPLLNRPYVRNSSTTWRLATSPGDDARISKCAVLDNGVLRVLVDIESGIIPSIKYLRPGSTGTPATNGVEMVSQRDSLVTTAFGQHTAIYWNYTQPRKVGTPARDCDLFFVAVNTPDMVDLGFRWTYDATKGDDLAMNYEIHYVLRRKASGLYVYVVAEHPSTYPAADGNMVQFVWPAANDGNVFTCENHYVDSGIYTGLGVQRNGPAPSFDDCDLAKFKGMTPSDPIVADATDLETGFFQSGLFDGKKDVKYAYNKNLGDPTFSAWGRASDIHDVGGWIVLGSHEFLGAGPTYTEYVTAWGLTYLTMNTTHYENVGFTVPAGTSFTKTYGPFFVYFNGLATGAAAWADAQAQADAEKAAWPYAWLIDAAYAPSAKRATVTGKLVVADLLRPGATAANAWIGLAPVDDGTENAADGWQFRHDEYQYWTRAAADGSFTIPDVAVRSTNGHTQTYALYAWTEGTSSTTGVVGEFSTTGFTLTDGATKNLGTLTWRVPHKGSRSLFEIGIPNRSGIEFKNGNRHAVAEIVKEFGTTFPNPLVFTPGVDNWATQLNYAHNYQHVYAADASPAVRDRANEWVWKIQFNPGAIETGTYWLNIAYALAGGIQIVGVNPTGATDSNGDPVYRAKVRAEPKNNNALGGGILRQSLRGKYTTHNFAIPHTALLANTTNTIELRIEYRPGAGPSRQSFIYDYINLEAPSVVADGLYKLTTESGGSVVLAQASPNATSSIALYAYNSTNPYHQWELENLGEDSSGRELVRLYNVASGAPLGYRVNVDGAEQAIATADSGDLAQLWQLAKYSGGYALRAPAAAYRALDGGTEALNTPLYVKPTTLAPEQLWFLSAP